MKSSLILYPHQLFALEALPDVDTVFLVEEPLLFGVDGEHRMQLHKQKLIMMRASMRRYAEEVLWPAGLKVEYIELDVFMQTTDLLHKVRKYDRVLMFDPTNETITSRLLEARRVMGDEAPALEFLPHPGFFLKEHEVRQYFAQRHKHPFAEFYQWQRERFNILLEDYKPVGGSWMIDAKPQKIQQQLPSFAVFGSNKWVQESAQYVNKHFPDNPGASECIWPTSHAEAALWLEDFVNKRLDSYGLHQEQFSKEAPWLWHSALSASLNIGLLTPQQVVHAALQRHARRPVPLESLEPFVRQILGHREFMRAVGIVGGKTLRTSNPLKASRRLTPDWYTGNTGIPVFDDVVKKLLSRAYIHNSERLLIVGTLMTICEITPEDMYRWFSELCIDTHDWALVPHIYSLSLFADTSTLEGGPYICTSKTLLDRSDYERGEWANIWDGLYWRFIDKNRAHFQKIPKMRTILQRLDRLDPDQRRIMQYRADDFLSKFTQ